MTNDESEFALIGRGKLISPRGKTIKQFASRSNFLYSKNKTDNAETKNADFSIKKSRRQIVSSSSATEFKMNMERIVNVFSFFCALKPASENSRTKRDRRGIRSGVASASGFSTSLRRIFPGETGRRKSSDLRCV